MLVVYNGVAKFRQAGKSAVVALTFGSFPASTWGQVAPFRWNEKMARFEYETPPAEVGVTRAEDLGVVVPEVLTAADGS